LRYRNTVGPHFAHTTYSQLGEADDSRVAVFSSWANTLNDAHSHGLLVVVVQYWVGPGAG
jgi:hypothetical protein